LAVEIFADSVHTIGEKAAPRKKTTSFGLAPSNVEAPENAADEKQVGKAAKKNDCSRFPTRKTPNPFLENEVAA
jgi:hypothetical protein